MKKILNDLQYLHELCLKPIEKWSLIELSRYGDYHYVRGQITFVQRQLEFFQQRELAFLIRQSNQKCND